MKKKFQEFFNKWNGGFCEVNDPTNKYQCMDLAYAWCDFLEIPRDAIRHLYAKEVYTKATDLTKQYFSLISNSPEGVPEVGDLVVFSEKIGGIAGHISIANGTGDTRNFESFDQNFGTPKSCRIVKHDYKAVIGWLRPTIEIEENMKEWFKTLLQESNLSLEREGEFRAFWDKAKRYDEEVTSLKSQIISANDALAQRATEVSALTEANQKLSDKKDEAEEKYNQTRSELNTATWNLTQLEIVQKGLEEKVAELEGRIKLFEEEKPLMAYSWWKRFRSLFS